MSVTLSVSGRAASKRRRRGAGAWFRNRNCASSGGQHPLGQRDIAYCAGCACFRARLSSRSLPPSSRFTSRVQPARGHGVGLGVALGHGSPDLRAPSPPAGSHAPTGPITRSGRRSPASARSLRFSHGSAARGGPSEPSFSPAQIRRSAPAPRRSPACPDQHVGMGKERLPPLAGRGSAREEVAVVERGKIGPAHGGLGGSARSMTFQAAAPASLSYSSRLHFGTRNLAAQRLGPFARWRCDAAAPWEQGRVRASARR